VADLKRANLRREWSTIRKNRLGSVDQNSLPANQWSAFRKMRPIDEGGQLKVGYFEFLPPSMLD
jgi:hypothetical protein